MPLSDRHDDRVGQREVQASEGTATRCTEIHALDEELSADDVGVAGVVVENADVPSQTSREAPSSQGVQIGSGGLKDENPSQIRPVPTMLPRE